MVTVQLKHLPALNAALLHNKVPIVPQCTLLLAELESGLANATLQITAQPEAILPFSLPLPFISAGQPYQTGALPLQPNLAYIVQLTEREEAVLCATLTSEAGEPLWQQQYPITLLPYDQWQGLHLLPEGLAAFVTPNHPALTPLLQRTAAILEQFTGNPSLDGYQSQSPNRVRHMLAALYQAMAQMDILYAALPASFEATGQRIRLPDTVLEQRMGNCLELALLMAAALEQMALHPLVVLIKGHAFAGLWLVEDTFADALQHDASQLSKRMAAGIHEISLVECTAVCRGKDVPFEAAEQKALTYCHNLDEFDCFIDVKRARRGGIKPLPQRIMGSQGWQLLMEEPAPRTLPANQPGNIVIGPKLVEDALITLPRQQQWERRLLDLSLRNGLLHMRLTRGTVQILCHQLGLLEDMVSRGESLQLWGRPTDWATTAQGTNPLEPLDKMQPLKALLEAELKQKRLRTHLPEDIMQASLTNLYRNARLSLEENGANTLYLAIGLLRWYQTEVSERPLYAPIVLLPVEMVRKVSTRSFVLRSRDEEPVFNITLLEMLRQDFGITLAGLDPLPRDAEGVDIAGVFSALRQAIMSLPRWEVEEQAVLGLFSFSKFVMWRDIHQGAQVLPQNAVVKSLLDNKLETTLAQVVPGEQNPQAPQVVLSLTPPDEQFAPDALLLPIAADGSQMAAIGAALRGESFVLHGPPGTGKSQTITNIIANALYTGKRVLFVAEKMAALEVVEKRLDDIGLGPYCLELHSNKAKKGAVMQQLKAAVEQVRLPAPDAFGPEAARLANLRQSLQQYHRALHSALPAGISLYQAMLAHQQQPPEVVTLPLPAGWAASVNAASLQQVLDDAETLQAAALGAAPVAQNPWLGTSPARYTQTLEQQLDQWLANGTTQAAQLQQALSTLLTTLQWQAEAPHTLHGLQQLYHWVQLLVAAPNIPASLWMAPQTTQAWQQLQQWLPHGQRAQELSSQLLQQFSAGVLTLPAQTMQQQWNLASAQWMLPRWWQQRKIKTALKQHATQPFISEDVPAILDTMVQYQQQQEAWQQALPVAGPLLGMIQVPGAAAVTQPIPWQQYHLACQSLEKLYGLAMQLMPQPGAFIPWWQAMGHLMHAGSQAFTTTHQMSLQAYIQRFQQFKEIQAQLQVLLYPEGQQQEGLSPNQPVLPLYLHQWQRWHQNLPLLRGWCAYAQARTPLQQVGLQPVIEQLEAGKLAEQQIAQAIAKAVYNAIAQHGLETAEALQQFTNEVQTATLQRFAQAEARYRQLCQQQIAATVAARMPQMVLEAAKSSEVGILQRAIANQARGLTIRQLFAQIPTLLPRLMPCMLMSPISVAQYLPMVAGYFDVIIFDEASQMPTSDAVGAMARGKSVIVVGDPRQMPPTSFFTSQQQMADEANEDTLAVEDLESILDDCLALTMPSRYLRWHYRSRHESLIAFSNSKFYENLLLTFPSPNDQVSHLQHVPVEGFYDRGRTKHNRAEAKAIVAEVVRRLQQPEPRHSLGVVTFNSVQQGLIQDLLDEAFAANPSLEAAATQHREPLFVKNLENVQGDERDVILFSVGYGRDAQGRLYLNFGPLNREGGWRRLNVAVSRARHHMVVFSTLRAADIDIARVNARGVTALQAFLQYAEQGRQALVLPQVAVAQPYQGFETLLAAQLQARGHHLHTRIGVSQFKIDLAVVHPQKPHAYVLAILADAPDMELQNAEAPTATDRYLGRAQVLQGLGWQVYRLWLPHYWHQPQQALQQIEQAIEQALQQATVADTAPAADPIPLAVEQQETKEDSPPMPSVYNTANSPAAHAEAPAHPNRKIYKATVLPPLRPVTNSQFLEFRHQAVIRRQLLKVLEQEAPITRNLLYSRIAQAWGLSRLTERVGNHLESLLKDMPVTMHHNHTPEVWPNALNPADFKQFRLPGTEADKREADDLPLQEIANAMAYVVETHFGLSIDDLQRETARLFGFARMGTAVEAAMQRGLIQLLTQPGFVQQDDRIVIKQ